MSVSLLVGLLPYRNKTNKEMSPENSRKISHLEPKILNSLVNWLYTDARTHKCKSRAGPTRGGPAKNEILLEYVSKQYI